MNTSLNILTAAMIAGGAALPSPAGAAPLGESLALKNAAAAPVQTVQFRRWGGRGWAPAAGFAAGAIIGGAIAASRPYPYYYGGYYDPGYAYAPGYAVAPDYAPGYAYGPSEGYVAVAPGGGDVGYCQQRFRSYDPASGTYLGFDGARHPCP